MIYNIMSLKAIRSLRLVLLLAVAALAVSATASYAQTDYSLRIRALGASFAGVVDDPFTDAFLNPARVGDLGGRQVYAARFPDRSLGFYYPDNAGISSISYLLSPEGAPGSRGFASPGTYTPYTIGFVTPVTGSATLSLALEMTANGYDDVSRNDEFRIDSYTNGDERVRTYSQPRGSEQSLYHVVADAALGTGKPDSPGSRLGVRFRFTWDQWERGSSYVYATYYSILPALEEVEMDYDYTGRQGEFETTGGELSVGLFRGGGFVAQAVLGAGGKRETLVSTELARRIYDDDYDGNGRENDGTQFPDYRLEEGNYQADRTYDGVSAFGRLGLRWGARVRSFHRVSWERNTGDGPVSYIREYYYRQLEINTAQNTIVYSVDGDADRFVTDHSVAFSDRFGDDVLVALGVRAAIVYERFDETGTGTIAYNASQGGTEIADFGAPYRQDATYERDYWLLILPAALEWSFHPSMALRFGMDFRATRVKVSGDLAQNVDLSADETFEEFLPFQEIDTRIDYATGTYLNMGFSFNFHDRLVLDLLSAVSARSFNLADVSTASLRFNF
jgi:hypothetical protein